MVVASIERPVKIHESPKEKGKSEEHGNVSSSRGNVIELLAALRSGEVGTLKGNRGDMRKLAARKYQGRARGRMARSEPSVSAAAPGGDAIEPPANFFRSRERDRWRGYARVRRPAFDRFRVLSSVATGA